MKISLLIQTLAEQQKFNDATYLFMIGSTVL